MPVSAILPAKTDKIISVFLFNSLNKDFVCSNVKIAVKLTLIPCPFNFAISFAFVFLCL